MHKALFLMLSLAVIKREIQELHAVTTVAVLLLPNLKGASELLSALRRATDF